MEKTKEERYLTYIGELHWKLSKIGIPLPENIDSSNPDVLIEAIRKWANK